MSFIRIKTISGKRYAYLVENKWYKRGYKSKGKGPRQRVSKYLGRVYDFEKANDVDFYTFKKIEDLEEYLKKNPKNEVFKDLIEWELFRHNIDKNQFTVDFFNKKIVNKMNKKIVSLKINEGFLNSFTLSRLFNLKSGDSYYLAKCFVEAGVEIGQDVFVGVFGK